MEIKEVKDNRGFKHFEFLDRYDTICTIHESSLADENAIWLGIKNANPIILASKIIENGVGWAKYPIPDDVFIPTTMHLTQDQVKEILPILTKFAETGYLDTRV